MSNLHPDDHAAVMRALEQRLRTRDDVDRISLEMRRREIPAFRRPDGRASARERAAALRRKLHGHIRPARARKPAGPGAENGRDRKADRRNRARLQQFACRRDRRAGPDREARQARRGAAARPRHDQARGRAGQRTGPAAARLRSPPAAGAPAVELAALQEAVLDLLTHTLGGLVNLEWQVADDVWTVFADQAQLELALVNLIINARDAMPDGGTVTIVAENRRGRSGATPGPRTRRLCPPFGRGHRHRHSARASAKGDGAFLHHQGGRQGQRARPQHGLWLRPAVERRISPRQRTRPRHPRRAVAAARPADRRPAGGGAGRTSSSGLSRATQGSAGR